MKRALLGIIILFSVCVVPCSIQAQPTIEWQTSPTGAYGVGFIGQRLVPTHDGGYAFVGNSEVYSDSTSIFITKIDHNGATAWRRTYTSPGYNYAACIVQTRDGGFIVGGSTDSSKGSSKLHGKLDAWVIKVDASGAVQWQCCYGGSGSESITSIIETTTTEQPEYVFAATCASNDGDVSGNHSIQGKSDPSTDAWIVKINDKGSILWQQCIGGSGRDLVYQMIRSNTNDLILAGWTESTDGDNSGNPSGVNMWLVSIRGTSLFWQKCYPHLKGTQGYSVCQTPDGGFVIGGTVDTDAIDLSGVLKHNACIVKVNSSGTEEWWQSFGGSGHDGLYSILRTSDGGFIGSGYTSSTDGPLAGRKDQSHTDVWIIKYSSTGSIQWDATYGGSSNDVGNSIFETNDGEYLFAAATQSNDGDIIVDSVRGGWVVKLTQFLDIGTVATTPEVLSCPTIITDRLPIRYYSTEPSEVVFELLTVTGNTILYTSDNSAVVGEREAIINTQGLSGGVYLLKIQNSNSVVFRKIIKE